MKASSAILVLFSGLAVASPLISGRAVNIDAAKAALKALDDKTAEVKAAAEERSKHHDEHHAKGQAAWKERVTKQNTLLTKLTQLLDSNGTAEEKDTTKQLADLINTPPHKPDGARPGPPDHKGKLEEDMQDYEKIANDLRTALE